MPVSSLVLNPTMSLNLLMKTNIKRSIKLTNVPSHILLKTVREMANISQNRLAIEYGISQSDISKYEAGKQSPRFDDVVGLIECMGFDFITIYAVILADLNT